MKHILLTFLTFFSANIWAAQVEIYRFYNGVDHFLTLDRNEGLNAGYQYEGVPFLLESEYQADRDALMRCYDAVNGDHFTSLDVHCEGKNNEGILGYAYRSPNNNSVQLWRCLKSGGGDHLTTTSPQECMTARYTIETDQGYGVATLGPGTTIATVYRFFNGQAYWYTTDYQEGLRRTGYRYEAIAFHVYSEPPQGVRNFALFQCRFNQVNAHFISNYQNCEGHTLERLIGFAPDAQLGGMIPLYRCQNMHVTGQILTTTERWDCTQRGLRFENQLYGLVRR